MHRRQNCRNKFYHAFQVEILCFEFKGDTLAPWSYAAGLESCIFFGASGPKDLEAELLSKLRTCTLPYLQCEIKICEDLGYYMQQLE